MKKYYLFFILSLLILPMLYKSTPTEVIKLRTFDALVKTPEPSDYFRILDITEEDVANLGGYPFPRQQLAQIHRDLINQGALGVGWVISFPQADRFGGDKEFGELLSLTNSVIALFENDNGNYPKTTGTVILGDDIGGYMSGGVVNNIKDLADNSLEGVASAPTDIDNLVRRMPLLYRTPDGWIAAFGTQVLKSLTGADSYIIKTNPNGIEQIRVQGLPPVAVDSLGRKWISWIVPHRTTLKEMQVAGKFVFVGVTAKGVMPQIATSVGLKYPHEVQAALAESILVQNSPYIPDYALAVEIAIFLLSVSLIWLVLQYFGITLGIALGATIMLTTGGLGAYAITRGLLVDVSWSLISQFITGAIAFYLRFREQYKLRQQIKKQFEHYLDKRQVKKLQENPDLLKLGGEKKYCTFLFTDVRGFTSLSESLEPEQVTFIMNKALTVQQNAVQKYSGMVDKYIGDAMMAIFNAPLDLDNHEQQALLCALEIQNNMKILNNELQNQNISPVQIGIGINSGYAIVGNMGSENRFDYTAIGDAVNVAARLESGTKAAGVDLLIGESTENALEFNLMPLEPIAAKGKKDKLQVYTWN